MSEFSANGVNGQLQILGDKIIITRKGLLSKMTFGSSTKEILLKNITAIQMKDAGFTNGYIQFAYNGSMESKGRSFSAAQDENSIVFNTWQKKDFHRIKAMIDAKREEIENRSFQITQPQIQQGHTVNDLEKFADLRDKGIISNDKFEAKKKQILGL